MIAPVPEPPLALTVNVAPPNTVEVVVDDAVKVDCGSLLMLILNALEVLEALKLVSACLTAVTEQEPKALPTTTPVTASIEQIVDVEVE